MFTQGYPAYYSTKAYVVGNQKNYSFENQQHRVWGAISSFATMFFKSHLLQKCQKPLVSAEILFKSVSIAYSQGKQPELPAIVKNRKQTIMDLEFCQNFSQIKILFSWLLWNGACTYIFNLEVSPTIILE